MVAALGVVLAAGAVGTATLLDDPTGAGSRDAAQSTAGAIAELGPQATRTDPDDITLPPFAAVLERPFPENLSEVGPRIALERLQQRASEKRDPRRLVELGVGHQRIGERAAADRAFRDALEIEPDYLPARVALLMSPGGGGPAGLIRTQRDLDALVRDNPTSELAIFNRGWTALYRRDADVAFGSFERVVALDPDSYLGVVAAGLLSAAKGQEGATAPGPANRSEP